MSRGLRTLAATVAGGLATLALVHLAGPGERSGPMHAPPSAVAPAPPGVATRGASPDAGVAALRLELDVLRGVVEDLAATPSGTAPTPEPKAPRRGADLLSEREHRAIQTALLDDTVYGAAGDVDFDQALARDVEATLRERDVTGASVREARCGGSICRLHYELDAPAAGHAALAVLLQAVPWEADGFFTVPDGAPDELVVFAAREGATLPTPEARGSDGPDA